MVIRSVAIALSLAMAVHCASKPKSGTTPAPNNKCTGVKGVASFDFNSFIGHYYKLAYLADVDEVKDYASGSETSTYIDGKWFFTFTVNKKDNSQQTSLYEIDKYAGSTIYETLFNNGERTTNSYSVHIYAYEPMSFVQFTVCGQGLNPELRFVLTYGDLKLTDDQKNKIKSNDIALNFTSKLVEIGKQGGATSKASSTKQGTKDDSKGAKSKP